MFAHVRVSEVMEITTKVVSEGTVFVNTSAADGDRTTLPGTLAYIDGIIVPKELADFYYKMREVFPRTF